MPKAVDISETHDLFGRAVVEKTTMSREVLTNVLKRMLRQLTLEEFVALITNRYEAMLEYAELVNGERSGQRISLLFNPHRLMVKSFRSPCSVFAALQKDNFVSGYARAMLTRLDDTKRPGLDSPLQMGVNGITFINEFPPYVMRDLCLRYGLNSRSQVLDPCGGWGGRLLGASIVAGHYTAFEPCSKTHHGLRRLASFINGFRPEFTASIDRMCYEDSPDVRAAFDFACTSPPYYDTEEYSAEGDNSLNRYATFDEWVRGFYLPFISKTMRALKPGSPFVLNIGSRVYPLSETLKKHFANKLHIKKLAGHFLTTKGLARKGEGETFYELRSKI